MEVGSIGCSRGRVGYAIVLRSRCCGVWKDAIDDVRGALEWQDVSFLQC